MYRNNASFWEMEVNDLGSCPWRVHPVVDIQKRGSFWHIEHRTTPGTFYMILYILWPYSKWQTEKDVSEVSHKITKLLTRKQDLSLSIHSLTWFTEHLLCAWGNAGAKQKTPQAESLVLWCTPNCEESLIKSNKHKFAWCPRPFHMLPSCESSLGGEKKKKKRGNTGTKTTRPNWASPINEKSRKNKARWKRLPEHWNALFQSLNWKCVHLVWEPIKLTNHPQHKDHPYQGIGMETSSPPEGLRLREIKRPGSLAPGNGKTRREHMPPRLAAAPLAWNECLHWPREAGSHRGLGGEKPLPASTSTGFPDRRLCWNKEGRREELSSLRAHI